MAPDNDDESLVDVPLEQPSTTDTPRKKLRVLERRASEGMVSALRKLSSQTKDFTKSLSHSLSDGLQSECVSKYDLGTSPGIASKPPRKSKIMSTILRKLETEELEGGDDDSAVSSRTDTSDFVGAGRTCMSEKELIFRHQLSMEPVLMYGKSDGEGVENDEVPTRKYDAVAEASTILFGKSPKAVETLFSKAT